MKLILVILSPKHKHKPQVNLCKLTNMVYKMYFLVFIFGILTCQMFTQYITLKWLVFEVHYDKQKLRVVFTLNVIYMRVMYLLVIVNYIYKKEKKFCWYRSKKILIFNILSIFLFLFLLLPYVLLWIAAYEGIYFEYADFVLFLVEVKTKYSKKQVNEIKILWLSSVFW